jgi:chitinase
MMPRVLVLVFVLLLASTCHGLNIGYVSNIDELQHFTTTHKLDRFTHIVVGGAALDAISLTVKFKTGNDLKLPSFSGKWLMGILGKGEGTVLSDFSKMALSKESRSKFIKSAIETAKQNGFEGVEIQWLFPAHPSYNGGVDDRLNFALLLQEFRIEIRNSKQKDFLLSAAGSAQAFSQNYGLRSGYAVKAVAAAVDWISIMGFDLAGPLYNHRTTHYSPLYRYSQSSALEEKIITAREAETLNVCGIADAVETWIELGAAPEKLVLVLPAFGKLWKLKFNQVIGLGAPSIPVKDESMLELDQSQISSFLKNPSTIVTSDSRIVSKYAVSSEYKMWLSYEDVQTISVKAAFAAEKKLGGIMIWSVEKDNDPSSLISDKAFDIFSSSASKWLSQYSQENQILKNSCTWGSLCKYLSGSDFTLQIMALVTVGLSMLLTSAIYVYQSPNDEDHSNDYAAIPEKAEVRSSAAELVERKDRRADKISPPFPEAGKISEHYTKISETPIESQQTRFASPGPRRKSNQ